MLFFFLNTIPKVKPTLENNMKSVVNVNNTRKSLVFRCKVQQAHPAVVFEWSECIDDFYNCSCGIPLAGFDEKEIRQKKKAG